jgi:amidase
MASSELHFVELRDVARALAAKELSPVEVTRAMLARIEALEPKLGSYALVTPELAIEQARAAEREILAGTIKSPLHGVPIAVKDLCWTKGIPTAAGMPIHKEFRPAKDATVVRRLLDAGAVLLGKLQLTEGAFADHHPSIRPPVNPWGGGVLARRVVERFRRRDCGRALLR